MRVKSCIASDGGGHVIRLSDEFGCVLRPKMISRFLKARGADDRASVITYAFFHAFKFPDALSVHIKCKVEICRHGCLDHCQLQPNAIPGDIGGDSGASLYGNPLERKDVNAKSADKMGHSDELEYEDIIQEGDGGANIESNFPPVSVTSQIQGVKLDDGQSDEDPDITVLPHKVSDSGKHIHFEHWNCGLCEVTDTNRACRGVSRHRSQRSFDNIH